VRPGSSRPGCAAADSAEAWPWQQAQRHSQRSCGTRRSVLARYAQLQVCLAKLLGLCAGPLSGGAHQGGLHADPYVYVEGRHPVDAGVGHLDAAIVALELLGWAEAGGCGAALVPLLCACLHALRSRCASQQSGRRWQASCSSRA
jgi:hypothetical protein